MVSYVRGIRIMDIWHKDDCANSASISNVKLCTSNLQEEKAPTSTKFFIFLFLNWLSNSLQHLR